MCWFITEKIIKNNTLGAHKDLVREKFSKVKATPGENLREGMISILKFLMSSVIPSSAFYKKGISVF